MGEGWVRVENSNGERRILRQSFGHWVVWVIGFISVWNLFGIWNLELGISKRPET